MARVFATITALFCLVVAPVALAEEVVGKWSVTDKFSPLTNLEIISASLQSEEKLANSLNLPEAATLVLRCSEGKEAAYVVWPQVVEPVRLGADTTNVLWKLDDGQIKSDVWNVSGTGVGAGGFDTASAQFLLKQFRAGKRLVVRITGSIPQDAVFDLIGIEPLVARIDAACSVRTPKLPDAILGPIITTKTHLSKAEIFALMVHQLSVEGFQIADSDSDAGTLVTVALPMHVSTKQADCGGKWGIPYLMDARAKTKVSYLIAARDGAIDVRTRIEGALEVSTPSPDWKTWSTNAQPLQCVSRGVIESDFAKKIGG